MDPFLSALASVVLISLVSFVGVATLGFRKDLLQKAMFLLIAFAAGTLLGGALFDLIPEAVAAHDSIAYLYLAGGILLFFIVERFIHLHHHHHSHEHFGQKNAPHKEIKPYAYLNLFGDAVHNFLDGTIVAAAFLVGPEVGIATTIAIILHEIPQEIGDFGILLHGGFSVRKALFYNFLSAITSVVGAVVAFWASSIAPGLELILLSIGGGGFLYIALANLIPELHEETNFKKIVLQIVFLILGMALLYQIGIWFAE